MYHIYHIVGRLVLHDVKHIVENLAGEITRREGHGNSETQMVKIYMLLNSDIKNDFFNGKFAS